MCSAAASTQPLPNRKRIAYFTHVWTAEVGFIGPPSSISSLVGWLVGR
jgi:hypothetical protein